MTQLDPQPTTTRTTLRQRFLKTYRRSLALRVTIKLVVLVAALATFITLSLHSSPELIALINGFAEVGLYCVAIPAGAFFLVWLTGFTAWRSTPAGESVVILGAMLEIVLIVNTLSLLLGTEYLGREYIRTVAYWGLGIAMVYLAVTAVRVSVMDLISRREDRARRSADLIDS